MPAIYALKPIITMAVINLAIPVHLKDKKFFNPVRSMNFNPAYMPKMAMLNNPPILTLIPKPVPSTNPKAELQEKWGQFWNILMA